jgi:hypothetical protein
MYELNNISDNDWNNLTGMDDKCVELMFTEEPPLALASNRKILGSPNETSFILSTRNRIQADIRIDKRDI